jgi:hypothetical protein
MRRWCLTGAVGRGNNGDGGAHGSGNGQQQGGSKVTEAKRRTQQSNEEDV